MKKLMSNAQHTAMVKEYKATGDDFAFNDIFMEVQELAENIAYKEWHKSTGLNMDKDEFVAIAYEGVMKAINAFNGDMGSNFVSFVKSNVLWAINDSIYKAKSTKKEKFHTDVLSLDYKLGTEGTFLDAVEHKISSDLQEHEYAGSTSADTVNDVFDAVADDEETESTDLASELSVLIGEFKSDSSETESDILSTVFETITDVEGANAKTVNKALAEKMPEIKSATLRKKKSRTLSKFSAYAEEKGFSINLSQY